MTTKNAITQNKNFNALASRRMPLASMLQRTLGRNVPPDIVKGNTTKHRKREYHKLQHSLTKGMSYSKIKIR